MRGSSSEAWLALGLWLAAALGRVRGQEGGWHSLSKYVSSCTYTANETAAEDCATASTLPALPPAPSASRPPAAPTPPRAPLGGLIP